MLAQGGAAAAGFDADQFHGCIVDERGEDSRGVRSAADAGDDVIRQSPLDFQALLARLAADHRLKIADDHRKRVRPDDRADDVMRVIDGAHPVAHRFVGGVLERLAAAGDFDDVRPHQLHAEDIQALPANVLRAHVDVALEPEQRRGGRGGDAMLAGAGLGDHALLAHAQGQQRLADGVVDLVSAGVIEIFALEVNFRAAEFFGQSAGEIEPAGPADKLAQICVEFLLKRRVFLGSAILGFELLEREDERLGNEDPAVRAKMAGGIG